MIAVEHVSKSFGRVHAVQDLSLHVPQGELFCFLGPNGAGKTTTIKMLAGLLRPDAGTIRLGGFDVQADPVAAKRILGYIPDMPYLYDRLTPVEFLRFVGELYRLPKRDLERRMDEGLTQFGLDPQRAALVGELSHGQRQRLLYVATLMHDPQVVLIDEPFIGLDPFTIRMIKDLLRRKARAGMTILLTTHILAVAEEIADRIGIISLGRLVTIGRMEELAAQSGIRGTLEDVFLKVAQDPTAPVLPEEPNHVAG
jgi:ABC-2 type transport system ATP-binding protein